MTEDGSLYYNYTNKGSVYQFDLSKLTPEERQKFSRLNDRQKLRFITLFEMEEPGKMKNEIAIRPDFNDDKSNERNNELRTLTAKINYLNSKKGEVLNRLLDDSKFQRMLFNESNGLITPSDINYVTSVNSNATLSTLKRYYTTLLSMINTEGEVAKIKKQLLGNNFSKRLTSASPNESVKLLTDILTSLKDFGPKFEDAIKTAKKYGHSSIDTIGDDLPSKAQEKIKEAKELEDSLTEVISKVFNKSSDEAKRYVENYRDDIIDEINNLLKEFDNPVLKYTILKVIPDSDDGVEVEEEGKPNNYLTGKQRDNLKVILNDIKDLKDTKTQADQYKNIARQLYKSFNIENHVNNLIKTDKEKKGEEDKTALTAYDIHNTLSELLNKGLYKFSDTEGYTKKYLNRFNALNKNDSTTLMNYVSTLLSIDDDENNISKATIEVFGDKIDGKSGSIKDRIKRLFRGNTEEDIKKISDNQVKQYNQTQGDLQSLKDRVNVLEQEVKNLQTNQPQSQSQPQPQPQQYQTKPSFLNDIRTMSDKPLKPLKPTEPSTKIPESSDDSLTSQFKKIMEERRKDIEPDEVEESDDEEWLASGISKMPLSDFLMNL